MSASESPRGASDGVEARRESGAAAAAFPPGTNLVISRTIAENSESDFKEWTQKSGMLRNYTGWSCINMDHTPHQDRI